MMNKSYICAVKSLNRHIALFLACIIYTASLFASPEVITTSFGGNNHTSFKKSETLKVSGFPKNEINNNSQLQHVADKLSGFHVVSIKPSVLSDTFISIQKTPREVALFYGALIQIGKKSLIFPFHSFW